MVLSTSENAANWPGGGHFREKTAMTSLGRDFARWTRLICRLLHTRVFVWSMVSPLHVFVRGGRLSAVEECHFNTYATTDAGNRSVFAYLVSLVRRSEIKHVPRYNSKLARVSWLKAMGVFCILDAEVQVLLMIYMVAFIIEHIWISYQEWIFGLIKKSN